MVKKTRLFIVLSFLTFTLAPTPVFAQATTSAITNETFRKATQEEKVRFQQYRQEVKEDRMEFKASKSAQRQSFLQTIKQTRLAAQAKFVIDRQAFQEKLQGIRDERKHQLVERIQNKMTMINTNRITIMSQKLEKLSTILATIQTKTKAASDAGKNTTTVDTTIINAESAITAAKTAIAAQAGKQYTITLTATEGAALKMDVSTTAKELRTDMQSTHALMLAAKQAVLQAAQTLSAIQ